MVPIAVHIKHAGKTYDVQLDVDNPPSAFKQSIYEVTGVPVDRMKVMIKGGVLKEDTPWKKVAPKEGQTFMVIGAAGELPKPPEKPTVFLEDLDDSELASSVAMPVGLVNLGNTCYMNASVQALRAIPELQVALRGGPSAPIPFAPSASGSSITTGTVNPGPSSTSISSSTARLSPLARALQSLYTQMGQTTSSVTPQTFLGVLRQVNPQFAEMARGGDKLGMLAGRMYAQQDAEECYGQILNSLREVPGLPPAPLITLPTSGQDEAMQVDESSSSVPTSTSSKAFIEQYMMGQMLRTMTCDEADEPPTTRSESVLKVECNITNTTNYLMAGIMNSLDQKIEKLSPSLGRQAQYTQRSRMSRLPVYLTVQMVRFAWRAEINKKAKIMRRVKFPTELDGLDLATDELKAKLQPVNRKLLEFNKDRSERRQRRKRTKAKKEKEAQAKLQPNQPAVEGESSEASAAQLAAAEEGGELEPEIVYRRKEGEELSKLVDESVKNDTGSNVSGLYDLVAIVTHKGAAADAGHYMGFVRKSALQPPSIDDVDDDDDWYKFDDEKVSIFPKEKLVSLEGGGEDSSAYVLLYKAKPLV